MLMRAAHHESMADRAIGEADAAARQRGFADIERGPAATNPAAQHDETGLRRAQLLCRRRPAQRGKRRLQLGLGGLGARAHQRLASDGIGCAVIPPHARRLSRGA